MRLVRQDSATTKCFTLAMLRANAFQLLEEDMQCKALQDFRDAFGSSKPMSGKTFLDFCTFLPARTVCFPTHPEFLLTPCCFHQDIAHALRASAVGLEKGDKALINAELKKQLEKVNEGYFDVGWRRAKQNSSLFMLAAGSIKSVRVITINTIKFLS